jgi:PAS domain S-box-containing protein
MLLMTLLICGAVLFVAIAALFSFQVLNFRTNFQRDTATLATIIANNSTAALAFNDPKVGAELVDSLAAEPTVVSASLVLPDGSLFAQFGKKEAAGNRPQFPPPGKFKFSGRYMLYTQPVKLEHERVGTLYLRSDYRRTLLQLLDFYSLVILGVMAVSVILAVLLSGRLQGIITDPVLQLAQTAQAVGEKKDYSLRVTAGRRGDELGQLTKSFNEMLARIQTQDQALKESRERFEVAIAGANDGIWDWNFRTNEVFFSPQWKRIIGYSDEEIQNTYAAWESLLHPADLGHVRAVLQDYLEGRRPTYEVEFRMREKSGQYRWILARGAALRDAENKPHRMAGSHTDIHGRKQAEVEVRAAREKFEALVNSIDGIVWECDADARFSFVSPQSERILGYTPGQWLADPNFWRAHLHPEDAPRVLQACRDSLASRKPCNCEYRMVAADGRTVWIHQGGEVLLNGDGQPALVRGIFLDITERKLAAAELDKLNQKLMETSRQAGMAEVAAGVLHNVGNVLNSVNVSATLVNDWLRQSKLPFLARAAGMLREQNGALASFLTEDPKGKVLPEYLANLSQQLVAEQEAMVKEVDHLRQNIQHIKVIVAMQQSYAKLSGVYENVPIAELVNDALRMNWGAFERHGITVTREFAADLPQVCVDRHKVLQILINLLRNAKYASDQAQVADKRLVVGVNWNGGDRVAIHVQDNGVGIAPENLTRIFAHGFTTKKDGHGFGLHSGANAAREMGGDLSVHSDGVGKGATFTLELPVANASKQTIGGEQS